MKIWERQQHFGNHKKKHFSETEDNLILKHLDQKDPELEEIEGMYNLVRL